MLAGMTNGDVRLTPSGHSMPATLIARHAASLRQGSAEASAPPLEASPLVPADAPVPSLFCPASEPSALEPEWPPSPPTAPLAALPHEIGPARHAAAMSQLRTESTKRSRRTKPN